MLGSDGSSTASAHSNAETQEILKTVAVSECVSIGSSLKFCVVAEGAADFYPRLAPTMEWDTAAGYPVLRAVGGQVLRFDDHQPLVYGKPGFENPFFLAMAPGVALVPPEKATVESAR